MKSTVVLTRLLIELFIKRLSTMFYKYGYVNYP